MGAALWLALGAFLLWNALNLQVDPVRVSRGLGRASVVFGRAFPPNFERGGLPVEGVVESLQMATLSTLFGVLLGVPVAVMAARNIAPLPVYGVARGIISLGRSFHEIIVAILFVKAVGFGPFAGMLTLILAVVVISEVLSAWLRKRVT